jgi:hypothetical protein
MVTIGYICGCGRFEPQNGVKMRYLGMNILHKNQFSKKFRSQKFYLQEFQEFLVFFVFFLRKFSSIRNFRDLGEFL